MNSQIAADFTEEFAKIADKYGYGDLGFNVLLFGMLIAVPALGFGMSGKNKMNREYMPYTPTEDFRDSSITGQY